MQAKIKTYKIREIIQIKLYTPISNCYTVIDIHRQGCEMLFPGHLPVPISQVQLGSRPAGAELFEGHGIHSGCPPRMAM